MKHPNKKQIISFSFIVAVLIVLFISIAIYKIDFSSNLETYESVVSKSEIYSSTIGDIQYIEKGEGFPVLLLHGVTGGVDQGAELAESYFEDNYKFFIVSRMGYLESALPENADITTQCNLYKNFLDDMGLKQVIIFGNSAGGTSAIKFSEMYPEYVKCMILVSSNLPGGDVMNAPPEPFTKVVFGNNYIYWLIIKLFGDRIFIKNFVDSSTYENFDKQDKNNIINSYFLASLPIKDKLDGVLFDMYYSNPAINKNNFLEEKIEIPTLFVHGVDDKSIPEEYISNLSDKIINYQIELYEGGHFLYGKDLEIRNRIELFLKDNLNMYY